MDDLLPVSAAAALLGLSPRRVYALIAAGRLHPLLYRRRRLLLRSEVEVFAETERTGGRPRRGVSESRTGPEEGR